jgi:hypothetical protein
LNGDRLYYRECDRRWDLGAGTRPHCGTGETPRIDSPIVNTQLCDTYKGYGCNMAPRLVPLHRHSLRFDEDLPLYGWLDDVDLCRRLSAYGRIVKNWNMIGVHLGTKRGRTAGIRLGYSQIANPIYLRRKGTLRPDSP